MSERAVFLDRDGVIVPDAGFDAEPLEPFDGVVEALHALRRSEWKIIVVTNQPVVGRGRRTEAEVEAAHSALGRRLDGCVDLFVFCPHHPNADVVKYRIECACRKPRPGMLLAASDALQLDLARSVMIGDRITDIEAGHAAGCRTVLVTTGVHREPRIESPDAPLDVRPDHIAADLPAAAAWVLSG